VLHEVEGAEEELAPVLHRLVRDALVLRGVAPVAAWPPIRLRPLCSYPKLARYTGSGSLEVSGSFTCQ
jgi:hypothetical protein